MSVYFVCSTHFLQMAFWIPLKHKKRALIFQEKYLPNVCKMHSIVCFEKIRDCLYSNYLQIKDLSLFLSRTVNIISIRAQRTSTSNRQVRRPPQDQLRFVSNHKRLNNLKHTTRAPLLVKLDRELYCDWLLFSYFQNKFS
jgi:hypothetical protein